MSMKNRVLCLIMFMVIVSGRLLAQFEGEIDMKITSKNEGDSHEAFLNMSLKQDMMAVQIKSKEDNERNAKLIFRGDQKVMWIISD